MVGRVSTGGENKEGKNRVVFDDRPVLHVFGTLPSSSLNLCCTSVCGNVCG